MSKFFCNGADSECNCPILCADCTAADWTGGTEIKTNADRIRAMTDEELIGFLMKVQDAAINRFAKFELPNYNALADWLQMPAGEEDKHGAD